MPDLLDAFWTAIRIYAFVAVCTLAGAGVGMALGALEDAILRRLGLDPWGRPLSSTEDPVKRRVIKGDEYDTVSWMRRYLCYLARPGATDKIKRRLRRRERHDAKHQIRRGDDDGV